MDCCGWIFNEMQVRNYCDFGNADETLVKEEINQILHFYVVRSALYDSSAGGALGAALHRQVRQSPPRRHHRLRRVARVRAVRRVHRTPRGRAPSP